ncbi:MAG: hypothetical protein ACQES5_11855, partial [Thermodesulfobacteriota bacterium]
GRKCTWSLICTARLRDCTRKISRSGPESPWSLTAGTNDRHRNPSGHGHRGRGLQQKPDGDQRRHRRRHDRGPERKPREAVNTTRLSIGVVAFIELLAWSATILDFPFLYFAGICSPIFVII